MTGAGSEGGNNEGRRLGWEDFERLNPKLVGWFQHLGTTFEEARELAQETFAQAHRSAEGFEGRSQYDTWVYSIARKVWLKWLRHRRTRKRQAQLVSLEANLHLVEGSPSSGNIESQLISKELLDRVSRSLDAFPETMRKVTILHVEGHPHREISQKLEIPENRVASILFRARAKLRREYGFEDLR